jgi:glycosyltransferase involved in cell wall biosynthesis
MGLSVLLLSRYARRGASSRVRFYIYREALDRSGITLTIAPFFDDSYLAALYANAPVWRPVLRAYVRRLLRLLTTSRYDLLWIEKEVVPWLPAWLERFAIGRIPYVVDFDDAWFLRYRQHRSPLIRTLCRGKLESVARDAALTIAGTRHLAQWARDSGAGQVLLLPAAVDLAHYPLRPPPAGPFTIGWIGMPSTAPYLNHIAGALRWFCCREAAQLVVIGAERFALDGVPIKHAPWDEQTEADLLSRCHVGIMPLPDDAWTRGKCGYKLVQYMAAGRPAIASPVGANKAIIRDGENGLLAATPQEWFDALTRLRRDPELRLELGMAGRRIVEKQYCVQVTARALAEALYAAAGRA